MKTGAKFDSWSYRILRTGYSIVPIAAGLDKFLHYLTDWEKYLSPLVVRILPFDPAIFMYLAGFIEISAGLTVAFRPRIGGLLVSGWLMAIVVNLILTPGFDDIALRDLVISLGALALSFLSEERRCPD